jgi:hypothetical protein
MIFLSNIVILITAAIFVQNSKANCRNLRNTTVDFGDFFVPNPSVLTDREGVLTSTNYPNDYTPWEQCDYIIKGPEGSRIRIEFMAYSVALQASFGFFDGNPSPFGGLFTRLLVNSSAIPPPYLSNTNQVGIDFSAGSSVESGWSLKYFIEGGIAAREEPLVVVDSGTSTFLLALIGVLGVFISAAGFIPGI